MSHATYGPDSLRAKRGVAGLDRRTAVRLLFLTGAACATLLISSNPAASIAVWSPSLATAACALAAIIGLSLFQLGALRFRAVGRPFDLLLGVGFGTLAVTNVFSAFLAATSAVPIVHLRTGSFLVLIGHSVADLIFAAAVLQRSRIVLVTRRFGVAAILTSSVLLLLAVGSVLVFWLGDTLPAWLPTQTMDPLRQGRVTSTLLRDEAHWMIAANIALALIVALTSYQLMLHARRVADPYLDVLVLGISLLAVAQLQAVLFPSGLPGYVSTADAFRLLAYLALLIGLTYRVTVDLAASASTDERLRLSRELHDGVVQQLTTLKLRINQALYECTYANERLNKNLEISLRLTEAALLEARHAITSLRSGTVDWEGFLTAVEAFCDEAARNHDIAIQLHTQGERPTMQAELQLEVLRILNETISNAVHHGDAKHIEVKMVLQEHPARLILTVRDDGRGFAPGGQPIGAGVGLRSLSERLTARGGTLRLDSGLAAGTAIRAELPLLEQRRWFA